MTSTEIVAAQLQKAEMMSAASILPKEYQKNPANILVAMEAAEALGVTLFQAIQMVTVINGRMTMSAEGMRALVLSRGHLFRIEKETPEIAQITVARAERPDDLMHFAFTAHDAKTAGLTGGNYSKYPAAMLLARATTKACRAVFPDVIAGISYAPEEAAEFTAPAPAPEPDPQPRPASAEQLAELAEVVKERTEAGIIPTRAEQRAELLRTLVGRPDATWGNLTLEEAQTLTETLRDTAG
jgi:hypothetical protein